MMRIVMMVWVASGSVGVGRFTQKWPTVQYSSASEGKRGRQYSFSASEGKSGIQYSTFPPLKAKVADSTALFRL